ncbi:peroxide/acid stress response protein YhcN [Erwinia sp. 9145]|uniref:peroxide/acid stress response protein YhcN n=1 Tax=Erwinia sp. 9145 TaxID=1500895 RepID=UPI00055409FB|nr:peroxide/acid stress response protein YhcN [Erwinia sp. 9145]
MKSKIAIAALSLAAVVSFGASAANLVTSEDVAKNNLQSVGTVTVSGIDAAPIDIRQQLSEKADQQGASAYRIIEAYTNGNYHATAELFK